MNYGHYNALVNRAGLTNHMSQDFGEVTTGRADPKAYCTSKACNGIQSRAGIKMRKLVGKDTRNCPDCNNALFWSIGRIRK